MVICRPAFAKSLARRPGTAGQWPRLLTLFGRYQRYLSPVYILYADYQLTGVGSCKDPLHRLKRVFESVHNLRADLDSAFSHPSTKCRDGLGVAIRKVQYDKPLDPQAPHEDHRIVVRPWHGLSGVILGDQPACRYATVEVHQLEAHIQNRPPQRCRNRRQCHLGRLQRERWERLPSGN